MPLVRGDPEDGSLLCRSHIPGLVWSENAVKRGQAYWAYLKAYWAQ